MYMINYCLFQQTIKKFSCFFNYFELNFFVERCNNFEMLSIDLDIAGTKDVVLFPDFHSQNYCELQASSDLFSNWHDIFLKIMANGDRVANLYLNLACVYI